MTNKSIKEAAYNFVKQYNLTNIDYSSLKKVAENIGYQVIEFNAIFNDKDVDTIINNLKINEAILKSRGFTYTDQNYRLIFVNEDLNKEEKTLVIAHELGHIVCEHFTSTPIIGNDVREEHEANEFSHYLLKRSLVCKTKCFINKHKKTVIITFLAMILVAISICCYFAVQKEQSYYGEYYITPTGNKYHEKECIFEKDKTTPSRLSKEDFEAGKYVPCDMCLP